MSEPEKIIFNGWVGAGGSLEEVVRFSTDRGHIGLQDARTFDGEKYNSENFHILKKPIYRRIRITFEFGGEADE